MRLRRNGDSSLAAQLQALRGCTCIAYDLTQWPSDSSGTLTARRNLRKHRLSFEEATTAFEDDRSVTVPDPTHSVDEERFLLLGRTSRGRIVVVGFTERSKDIDTIRLISARLADHGERHDYEEGQQA